MRTARWFSWSGWMAVGLLLAGSLSVRADDLLGEAKARRAVEAQRVEKLISDAQVKALSLQRMRPGEAAEYLRSALAVLAADQSLDAKRRESLIRSLTSYAKQLNADAAELKSNPTLPRYGASDLRRAEQDRLKAEADYINRTQSQVRAMQDSGNAREARKMHDELMRRFPSNPAVQAGSTITGRGEAVASRNDLARKRNDGWLMAYRDVEKSALIPVGEVSFSKDPAVLARLNKRTNASKMTDKEKAILKALNTTITVEFTETPIEEVLNWLQKTSGQTIAIDPLGIKEAGIEYKTTVTIKTRATLRSVLKKVLGDVNMTYIVKDETIQATSIARARETLSARTYYVGDLIARTNTTPFNPYLTNLQMAFQVQQLAVTITKTVEPQSWAVNGAGGLGTLAFDPITMSFIVRQTAEIHFLMGVGMQ